MLEKPAWAAYLGILDTHWSNAANVVARAPGMWGGALDEVSSGAVGIAIGVGVRIRVRGRAS